jgi:hypothetical protein
MKRFLLVVVTMLPWMVVALDRVHLTDGKVMEGEILNLAEAGLSMNLRLPGVSGFAKREVAVDTVDFIDFSPIPGLEEAMANPKDAGQQAVMLKLWQEHSVRLRWPTNPIGKMGLVFAEALYEGGGNDLVERAMRIYALIEKEDWDELRRARAKSGRLRCLIRLQRFDEAIVEARQMAEETDDPRLVIEAGLVIAEGDFAKFKAFEEKHPRWDQDDELTEERIKRYHALLDQFLQAPLFYGAVEDLAARGLWRAVEVHQYVQEPLLAVERARDLVKLYPQAEEAVLAKKLLEVVDQSSDKDN